MISSPQEGAPAAAMAGSGRASHRGGARAEARPGDGIAGQMAAMNLAGGDPRGGVRRRRDMAFLEQVNTRPAHIQSKQGKSGFKQLNTLNVSPDRNLSSCRVSEQ